MFPVTPLYFAFRYHDHIGWNFYTGLAIALFGIVMSAIADQQLYNWSKKRQALREKPELLEMTPDDTIENQRQAMLGSSQASNIFREGLWTKSRHPNLFYEFIAWIGFAVVGLNDWSKLISIADWVCGSNFTRHHNVLRDHSHN